MELTLVGLQNSGKTTLVNVIAVSSNASVYNKRLTYHGTVRSIHRRCNSYCRIQYAQSNKG